MLVLLGAQVVCHPSKSSIEQIALDDFVSRYWGEDLFEDECTGLRFEPTAPLVVFRESPGYEVDMTDFLVLAGIDPADLVDEEGGLERLKALQASGTREGFSDAIDLGAHSFARSAESPEPKDDWKPVDGYLLRFSNRLHFEGRTYLQTWVKASHSSSGVRVDFEFDQGGQLLRSRKHGRICDYWG